MLMERGETQLAEGMLAASAAKRIRREAGRAYWPVTRRSTSCFTDGMKPLE